MANQIYMRNPYISPFHLNNATQASCLLVVVIITISITLGSSSTLALNATRASTTVWGGESKVDVLLRVKANNERGNVDNLFTNT